MKSYLLYLGLLPIFCLVSLLALLAPRQAQSQQENVNAPSSSPQLVLQSRKATDTGGLAAPLILSPQRGKLLHPSWSPDGRYLVASGMASLSLETLPQSPEQEVTIVSAASTLRIWNRESGGWITPPWQKEPTITRTVTPTQFDGRPIYKQDAKGDIGSNISLWRWTSDSQTLITVPDNNGYNWIHLLESWQWPSGPRNWADVHPIVELNNATAIQKGELRRDYGDLNALEISSDNRTIAVGTINPHGANASARDAGSAGSIVLRDIQSGDFAELESGPDVKKLAFSPAGKWLAVQTSYLPNPNNFLSASSRRKERIDIWDVADRKKVASIPIADISFLGWLDNARLLLSGVVYDKEVAKYQIYSCDLRTVNPTLALLPLVTHDYQPLGFHAAFALQSGRLLARTSQEYLWFSLPKLEFIASVPNNGEGQFQESPVLSPDATVAAVEREDGTLQLWHTERDKQQAALAATIALLPTPVGQAPDWVIWTPDGRYDCSPGATEWMSWQQDGHLLPASEFPKRQRPRLLREIAPLSPLLEQTQ